MHTCTRACIYIYIYILNLNNHDVTQIIRYMYVGLVHELQCMYVCKICTVCVYYM